MEFSSYDMPKGGGDATLVVVSGLPGVGKSTLADAIGTQLKMPVFAFDWVLGALTPFGGRQLPNLMDVGYELLTTLGMRQLVLGQSAILDGPVEDPGTRTRWRSLAAHAGARFRAIVCVCPDQRVHRERLEGRRRGIPGWHDAGNWSNVVERLSKFPAWEDDALVIDTTRPHEENLEAACRHITAV